MGDPIFNSTYRNFTRRDSLGLQSLSTAIQAEICPVINVVTPHPFYWAFLIWNYYHYYSLEENKNKPDSEFNKDFVKRNDFFFVLANHLGSSKDQDMDGVVGKNNIQDRFPNKSVSGPFKYDETYYKSHFGGMQYYNNGCFEMHFVNDNRRLIGTNKESLGHKLTNEFDKAISNTSIYKKYISKNIKIDNVSREDLLELSKYLKIKMPNMTEVKRILYDSFFPDSTSKSVTVLKSVETYINLLIQNNLLKREDSFYGMDARRILYGDKQPLILNKVDIKDSRKNIFTRWELVIANQYYVACIEMLWQYLLSILTSPCTQDEWIDKALSNSKNINKEENLISINSELSFEEIESKITNNPNDNTVHNVLMILMSIYKRFENRMDDFYCLNIEKNKEYYVFDLLHKIKNGQLFNIDQLFKYLFKHHIIDRHEKIATAKRYQGRDGFLFEKVDSYYFNRGQTIEVSMPPLRITNVFSVLKDLGKI